MRQSWCTRLKIASFTALLAVTNTAHAVETTLECSIIEENSKTPLQLTIEAVPAIEGEYSSDVQGKVNITLSENSAPTPSKLAGPYQSYYKNELDLERVDYQPLGLLGLMESDIAHAAYFYGKEDPSADLYDLMLVSIMTEDTAGNLVYAGSYGSYKERNVLCKKE